MNSNDNYLPPDDLDISNAEDEILENQSMIALAEKYRIKAADKYDKPDYTLEQNGIGFAPRGNIMALMAEMKHGKTFVNMSFAAALLKGEFLGLKGLVPNASVIFFDTEQDMSDGQLIQRRVHFVNGWDFNIDNDRFRIFHLREIPSEERREFISWAIRFYKPTCAIIDGVRDLLKDFNNLEESADLIQELMKLSSETNSAIWTVLHVNPNSDKMRGHLGTELGNKVTDVFKVVKTKNKTTGEIFFEVNHEAARHRDVDGWKFFIDDDLPFGIPQLLNAQQEEDLEDTKLEVLDDTFKEILSNNITLSKRSLREKVQSKTKRGKDIAEDIISQALESGIIKDEGNERCSKYRYYGLPRVLSDEKQSSMPF